MLAYCSKSTTCSPTQMVEISRASDSLPTAWSSSGVVMGFAVGIHRSNFTSAS